MAHIIDWHSHILPAIDDGSKDVNMSLGMLQEEVSQGVEHVILSPHFYASRMTPKSFIQKRKEAMELLLESVEKNNGRNSYPTMIPAAEVAWFSGIGNMDEVEELCIRGTNLLLLEMPFQQWSSYTIKEIERMIKRKILPVIVHCERYYRLQKDRDALEHLMELPVVLQYNAESLVSFFDRKYCLSEAREGRLCLLGSDAHNLDKRKPNLKEGREILRKKLGQDYLDHLDEYGNQLLKL